MEPKSPQELHEQALKYIPGLPPARRRRHLVIEGNIYFNSALLAKSLGVPLEAVGDLAMTLGLERLVLLPREEVKRVLLKKCNRHNPKCRCWLCLLKRREAKEATKAKDKTKPQ